MLEALSIAPEGSVKVEETLDFCAVAMTEAGQFGNFTPMHSIDACKPAPD